MNAEVSIRPDGSIFVLDTNVLYSFYEKELKEIGFKQNGNDFATMVATIQKIFDSYRVFIPQVCMVEFASRLLHCNIDLDDYQLWFRKRISIFKQFTAMIYAPEKKYQIALKELKNQTKAINHLLKEIPSEVISYLHRKDKQRGPEKRYFNDPKYLDGQDAIVLFTFLQVASEFPDQNVFLITNDQSLQQAVEVFMRSNKPEYYKLGYRSIWSLDGRL